MLSFSDVCCVGAQLHSLQLLLLNEPALVLVDDGEGALEVCVRLASQTACMEELLVVEFASVCRAEQVRSL